MTDQADKLRILVQSTANEDVADLATQPVIVVAGGRSGVGVTTLATDLAIELRRRGRGVTLVDADLENPSIAKRLNLPVDSTIDDIFSGNRTVQEALVQGPAGIRILPGASIERETDVTPTAQRRMLNGIFRGGAADDLVVLDVGARVSPNSVRFWASSSLVLLVSNFDPDSIMGAYSAVKLASILDTLPPITTVVPQSGPTDQINDVHRRLAVACQRFLNQTVQASPPVYNPVDQPHRPARSSGVEAIQSHTRNLHRRFLAVVESIVNREHPTIKHAVATTAA